ncbi:antitoxin VapB family protein [Thermococcus sp.]
MVKTITISDDVYNELLRIKGDKSFSELFRELLRKKRATPMLCYTSLES